MADFIERDFKQAYIKMKERALDAEHEVERLRAALKDIQAQAVGVKPPRHSWYYDRAESALATPD